MKRVNVVAKITSDEDKNDDKGLCLKAKNRLILSNNEYKLSKVIPNLVGQNDIYKQCEISNLVKNCVHNGGSSNVVCMSQRHGGKLHTMLGSDDVKQLKYKRMSTDGILPRVASAVFKEVNKNNNESGIDCYASCMSIGGKNMANIQDVLNLETNAVSLKLIRSEKSSNAAYVVDDLCVIKCESELDLLSLISHGYRNSNNNFKDGCSHWIFTIYINTNRGLQLRGKLNFIILADSNLSNPNVNGSKGDSGGIYDKELAAKKRMMISSDQKALSAVLSEVTREDLSGGPTMHNEELVNKCQTRVLTKVLMDSIINYNSSTLLLVCLRDEASLVNESLALVKYCRKIMEARPSLKSGSDENTNHLTVQTAASNSSRHASSLSPSKRRQLAADSQVTPLSPSNIYETLMKKCSVDLADDSSARKERAPHRKHKHRRASFNSESCRLQQNLNTNSSGQLFSFDRDAAAASTASRKKDILRKYHSSDTGSRASVKFPSIR